MPSERRSKEDTWTPNELKKALGKDTIRREREERKKERLREEQNGEDRRRRKGDTEEVRDKRNRDRDRDRDHHHRNEDDDRRRRKGSPDRIDLTEDERERQRRERREKKEGKSKEDQDDSKRRRHKDEDREKDERRRHRDDDDRRRHRDDDDRRKHRDDDDRRKHRDDDGRRKHRDDDDRRKHRDDDDRRRHRDDDDREKRRHKDDERRRHRDDDDRERRKHRDDDDRDRRKEKKDRDRHKGDDEDKRKHHRHGDSDEEVQLDEDERERQRRERREKREGKDLKDKDRHREKDRDRDEDRERRHREDDVRSAAVNGRSKAPKKEEKEEEENDYGDYEDDFEDYEEDFEDFEEDDDQPQGKDDEMNQVLRALDEENDRLYKDSKKNESRYDRDSSPEDDRGRGYRDRSPEENVTRHRPRTAINFASAKKRVMSQQAYGKTSKRAQDLFQMIELDTVAFDLMDLPPVKEYELYIRSYGRSDTRQAYVQTNDDAIDRDIQTDEIDLRSKWTQHPAEDFAGSGRGDGEKDFEDEEQSQQNKHQDLSRLSKFIQQAGQVMSILLDEERSQEKTELSANKSNISMSEGYTELSTLPLLKGRHVEFAYFAPTQPNMLLTVYSQPEEDNPSNPTNGVGIICVWNTNEPSYPQRILACESQPRCCCFSPYKTSIAFAGMVDGSICAWDLREPPSLHRSVEYYKTDHLLRFPTYNTAGIAESDNHISPVTTINPAVTFFDESSQEAETADDTKKKVMDSGTGMSFQLVSSEDQGRINFWVVAELSSTDQAGSEIDLGLSPGGKIKVVISSTIKLENLMREARLLAPVRSFEMQISPTDPNHFYIGTDGGYVLHGLRFGNRAFPRTFSALTDSPVDVKMIDFSPFGHPCFLATTADGVVHLFGTKTEKPLLSWPAKIWGTKNILCAKWSRCRPCVFYVLDDKSHLYTFDILEMDSMPSKMEPLSEQKVKHLAFTSYIKVTGRLPQMLVSHEDGTVQIHTISKEYREQQTLENDFLPSYLGKF